MSNHLCLACSRGVLGVAQGRLLPDIDGVITRFPALRGLLALTGVFIDEDFGVLCVENVGFIPFRFTFFFVLFGVVLWKSRKRVKDNNLKRSNWGRGLI